MFPIVPKMTYEFSRNELIQILKTVNPQFPDKKIKKMDKRNIVFAIMTSASYEQKEYLRSIDLRMTGDYEAPPGSP